MTSPKPEIHIEFEPLIETINNDYYGGRDISRAFVHWAMREILAAQDLSGETLQEQTLIGGKGDCGIDGWWFEDDQDPPTLHLFQGKYGTTPLSEKEIDELWRAPDNLFDPLREKNEYASQLARDLTQWLKSGATFSMHFVTMSPIGGTAESRAAHHSSGSELSVRQDGKVVSVPVEFSLCVLRQMKLLPNGFR